MRASGLTRATSTQKIIAMAVDTDLEDDLAFIQESLLEKAKKPLKTH